MWVKVLVSGWSSDPQWDKMCHRRTQTQSKTFNQSQLERHSEGSHCQTDWKNSGFNKATHPSSEGSWGNLSWWRQQSNAGLGCLGNMFWPSVNDSAFVWSQPHQQRDAQICLVISVTQQTPQKYKVSPRRRRMLSMWMLSRHCLCEPCNYRSSLFTRWLLKIISGSHCSSGIYPSCVSCIGAPGN